MDDLSGVNHGTTFTFTVLDALYRVLNHPETSALDCHMH